MFRYQLGGFFTPSVPGLKPDISGTEVRPPRVTPPANQREILRTKEFARIESELFARLIREVDSNKEGQWSKGFPKVYLGKTLPVRNREEEIMYNISQLARMASSLSISLTLTGFLSKDINIDFFDVRYMAFAAEFGSCINMLKNFNAWPLSYLQSSREVPKPISGWNYEQLMGPRVRAFVLGRIFNPNTSHAGSAQPKVLAECFLRNKRSAKRVSDVYQYEALVSHSEILSIKEEPLPGDLEEATYTQEMLRIQKYIVKIVDALCFERETKDESKARRVMEKRLKRELESFHIPCPRTRVVAPSSGASFASSRLKGGAIHGSSRAINPGPGPETGKDPNFDDETFEFAFMNEMYNTRPELLPSSPEYQELRKTRQNIEIAEYRKTHPESAYQNVGLTRREPSEVQLEVSDIRVTPFGIKTFKTPNENVDYTDLFHTADDAVGLKCLQDNVDNKCVMTRVVPICEPLKVRVITAGDAVPYLDARRLQVWLTKRMTHGKLKKFFPALHGPVTADVLNTIFAGHLSDSCELLGGDYSKATDKMRKCVSEFTIKDILGRFDEYTATPLVTHSARYESVVNCLINHQMTYKFCGRTEWGDGQGLTFDYASAYQHLKELEDGAEREARLKGRRTPKRKTRARPEEWEVKQETGQLMGSFLSFPVLNIVNLATHLAFYEKRGLLDHNGSLDDILNVPVAVNGDDVVAVGPQGTFTVADEDGLDWEKYVSIVGFEKSLGKNYISSEFTTINSILFVREGESLREVNCPRVERLYNTEWYLSKDLRGPLPPARKDPSGSASTADSKLTAVGPKMVGGLIRELLRTVPVKNHELVIRLFIEFHKEELKQVPNSWFLPEDLDGLGIPAIESMRCEWERDAIVAAYMCRKYHTQSALPLVVSMKQEMTSPADLQRAEYEMEYLKFSGWQPWLVVNPSHDDLAEHDSRPRPDLHDPTLLTFGWSPDQKRGDVFKNGRRLTKLSKRLHGEASHQKDLRPFDLDQNLVRVLWRKEFTF